MPSHNVIRLSVTTSRGHVSADGTAAGGEVLVAELDPGVRRVLKRYLEKHGFIVHEAPGLRELPTALSSSALELSGVVTDDPMVAERVYGLTRRPVFVVVPNAPVDWDVMTRLQKMGAIILSRPLEMRALLAALQSRSAGVE